VIESLHAHQALDAALRAPPQYPVLEQAAAERPKMLARERLAPPLGKLRKAQREIGQYHASPRARERIQQHAERAAQGRQQREGQKMQQPDEPEADPLHGQVRVRDASMHGMARKLHKGRTGFRSDSAPNMNAAL
jgi:hypothetical protein